MISLTCNNLQPYHPAAENIHHGLIPVSSPRWSKPLEVVVGTGSEPVELPPITDDSPCVEIED